MKLLPLARLKGRIEARNDFQSQVLKCKNSSHQCGNACVPKKKKCRSSKKLRLPEQELTKIVHDIEDRIKDEPIEHAVIIDKNGRVLLHKTGDRTSVGFSGEEVEKMEGAIVTHNHPNLGWGKDDARSKGLSFSLADMQLAVIGEVKEMRAVSSGYRHSLKPPSDGWTRNIGWENTLNKLSDSHKKHSDKVYWEFVGQITTGKMRRDVGEAEFHHEVNKRVAKDLGMTYKREEIKNV